MPEAARTARVIRNFPGLVLEHDIHDLPEGATDVQVNCTSEDQGVLKSRSGYVTLEFEGE